MKDLECCLHIPVALGITFFWYQRAVVHNVSSFCIWHPSQLTPKTQMTYVLSSNTHVLISYLLEWFACGSCVCAPICKNRSWYQVNFFHRLWSHGSAGSFSCITASAQSLSWDVNRLLFIWSLLYDLVSMDELFEGNIFICTAPQSHGFQGMVLKKIPQTDTWKKKHIMKLSRKESRSRIGCTVGKAVSVRTGRQRPQDVLCQIQLPDTILLS